MKWMNQRKKHKKGVIDMKLRKVTMTTCTLFQS